jgi:hypothetical protein
MIGLAPRLFAPLFTTILLAAGPFAPSSVLAQGPQRATTAIEPGERCPAGMTEIRPQTCMAPEFPAPAITDYHPRSTLVTSETPVPRARFPVVDMHGHARGLATPGVIDDMVGHWMPSGSRSTSPPTT